MPYLLSRTLDPLLGVFTGILAYHLHETNPRSAPPPGHTLRELIGWQWGINRDAREARSKLLEAKEAEDMEKLRREVSEE